MQIVPSNAQKKNNLGLDLMGGDYPPHELLDGIAAHFVECKPSFHLTLFGPSTLKEHLEELFSKFSSLRDLFSFVLAEEVIHMDEAPLTAIRKKKKSSLSIAVEHLKEKKIDGLISCGNTGALVAASLLVLPMIPKIERPALSVMMPTQKNSMLVLDVGANVSPKAKHLVQYAKLGAAFQLASQRKKPSLGLLNIGAEAVKGTELLRDTYQELQKENNLFSFAGNLEGKDAFNGKIDLLVTDGFTGNIFLKTAEGFAQFVFDRIEQKLALSQQELFPDLKKHLHYAKYPGALLLGIDAMVIKCHSYAKSSAIISAVEGAHHMLSQDLLAKTKKKFTNS